MCCPLMEESNVFQLPHGRTEYHFAIGMKRHCIASHIHEKNLKLNFIKIKHLSQNNPNSYETSTSKDFSNQELITKQS